MSRRLTKEVKIEELDSDGNENYEPNESSIENDPFPSDDDSSLTTRRSEQRPKRLCKKISYNTDSEPGKYEENVIKFLHFFLSN